MAAAYGFLVKLAENNCKENHFSLERFSKTNSFTGFSQFLPFFKNPANIKMEPFAKLVNSSRGVFRTESNI